MGLSRRMFTKELNRRIAEGTPRTREDWISGSRAANQRRCEDDFYHLIHPCATASPR